MGLTHRENTCVSVSMYAKSTGTSSRVTLSLPCCVCSFADTGPVDQGVKHCIMALSAKEAEATQRSDVWLEGARSPKTENMKSAGRIVLVSQAPTLGRTCCVCVSQETVSDPPSNAHSYGLLAGVAAGCTISPSLGIVGQWFEEQRATAMGIAFSGSGLGICLSACACAWMLKELLPEG